MTYTKTEKVLAIVGCALLPLISSVGIVNVYIDRKFAPIEAWECIACMVFVGILLGPLCIWTMWRMSSGNNVAMGTAVPGGNMEARQEAFNQAQEQWAEMNNKYSDQPLSEREWEIARGAAAFGWNAALDWAKARLNS